MDERHLERAVQLSLDKMRAGAGGPFGAVVARGAQQIAEGWNQVTSANDPTAHAEIVAIRRAAAALGTFDLSGCTLYASTEPCPMCLAAAYWARVDSIVFANRRDAATAAGFDDARITASLPSTRKPAPCPWCTGPGTPPRPRCANGTPSPTKFHIE